MKNLSDFREEYNQGELWEARMHDNPLHQFSGWMQEAIESGLPEPNAMILATALCDGTPSARIVLLKEVTSNGFVFFTNYESRKGKEIAENPHVALVFPWHPIERQVRVEGVIEKIPAEDSDAYFNSRPETSKLGAWVSPQSKVLHSREELDHLQQENERKFFGKPIHRPTHWGGYLIIPHLIEFWQGRPNRLHDRILYLKSGKNWKIQRLAA